MHMWCVIDEHFHNGHRCSSAGDVDKRRPHSMMYHKLTATNLHRQLEMVVGDNMFQVFNPHRFQLVCGADIQVKNGHEGSPNTVISKIGDSIGILLNRVDVVECISVIIWKYESFILI